MVWNYKGFRHTQLDKLNLNGSSLDWNCQKNVIFVLSSVAMRSNKPISVHQANKHLCRFYYAIGIVTEMNPVNIPINGLTKLKFSLLEIEWNIEKAQKNNQGRLISHHLAAFGRILPI